MKLGRIMQFNLEGKTKDEVAIERIKTFEPPEGYYLAFSGGKDSIIIYDLAVKAGVKFDAHYSQGGIDPPELVRFIRKYYPNISFDRPEMSVWQGIQTHGMPRRQSRWCCELIKEHSGKGRVVITGIRWAESARRRQRRMFEVCQVDNTKRFLHPIIDWENKEVWEYIRGQGIPYCSLYDEGFRRLGCVLCPMQTPKQAQIELRRWPKLAEAWKHACYRLYEKRKAEGRESVARWNSAEEMWQWWLSRKGETKISDAQCIMFDNT